MVKKVEQLTANTVQREDPIQLVWMVNQAVELPSFVI
jgi:hypothetical protein